MLPAEVVDHQDAAVGGQLNRGVAQSGQRRKDEVERGRLAKRVASIEADLAKGEAKLAGEGFVSRAPVNVVEKERRKVAALKEEAATLAAQIEELG